MFLLYGLLTCMFVVALSLIWIPFIKDKSNKRFLVILSVFMAIVSFVIYQFSSNKLMLANWLAGGKSHYDLLEKFDALGGVEGAIKKIELRLKENPNDVQGWMILGKLYLAEQNYERAAYAFKKVSELQPQNERAKHYYEMIKKLK